MGSARPFARFASSERYPPGPPFSSSKPRLRRVFDEPWGPRVPSLASRARSATPLDPRSPPPSPASGGSLTSHGVRASLRSLRELGALPPWTPVLLLQAPPPAGL